MTDDRAHLGELLDELLDGRLSGVERARAEAHLAECEKCGRDWRGLSEVRQAVRRAAAAGDVPPELARQIRAALDGESALGGAARDEARGAVPRRTALVWLAAAAGLILAGVAALLLRPSVSDRVAGDFEAYRAGGLALEKETASAEELEAFFRERGITFSTRVLDLGMMGYRLVGGRVHRIGDRPSALFVYRGEGNKILVCQMYPGPIGQLPRSAQRLKRNGMTFHVVRRGQETLVFWQEGDVACVLVSDIPSEEVVALAVAKAMKP